MSQKENIQYIQKTKVKIMSDFSSKMMEVRRQWSNIFKGLRVKKGEILCLLTPSPNLFEKRSWMMTFIDIHMLKDFVTRKATQQKKLKEPSKKKGTHVNWNSWCTQRKENVYGYMSGKLWFFNQLYLFKNMGQFFFSSNNLGFEIQNICQVKYRTT